MDNLGSLRGQIVVCAWAEWKDVARIISLRKATKNEQEEYLLGRR